MGSPVKLMRCPPAGASNEWFSQFCQCLSRVAIILRRSGCHAACVLLPLVVGLATGCASGKPSPETEPTKPGPDGVLMQKDKDFDWAWTAPGVDFTAYDTLLLTEPRADVKDLKPDNAESLEWARGLLREKFLPVLRESRLFKTVTTQESEVPPDAQLLRLDTRIVEYDKGSAALRAFTGLGGHPLLTVQGRLVDTKRLVFAFEELRGGGVSVRFGAAFRPNRDLQQADLTDIAQLLVDHIVRVTGRKP